MLRVANNEDREEYLKIKYNINHTVMNINPNIISKQNKIPT